MPNNKVSQGLADLKIQINEGRFVTAQSAANALLKSDLTEPERIETLYCLAVCQRKQKNVSDAKHSLSQIFDLAPQYARAHQELGYLRLLANETEQAIAAFEHATSLNPALHGAWRALANINHYEKADIAQQHLRWLQSLPNELVTVISLIHQNKLKKAEKICRDFLRREPHHPEGMRLLAELGRKFGILDDAEAVLLKCLELSPNYTRARLDYIEVLHRRQKFSQALAQAQSLVDGGPNNPNFILVLANAQQAMGDYPQAIANYRLAEDHMPTTSSIKVALGNALKTSGQTDLAIQSYKDACRLPTNNAEAFWSLSNLKTHRFEAQDIKQMQMQLTHEVNDQERAYLCFALGKALEDRQEYARSFDYYERGNAIKRQQQPFDFERYMAELDHQRHHFDENFFAQRQHYGCPASDPIFILGLPRAGSTLLEQVLASHSEVDGTFELSNIIAYAHQLNGRHAATGVARYPSILDKLSAAQSQRLGERYLSETKSHRQGARFFIDKMPNNFRHIALISLILPRAKIIDARRDPMAGCFSGFKQLFAEGQEFSYSLYDLGRYYREYERIMAHWDKVLPGRILRVDHENVLDDLDGQVRRLLDFCGLDFEQNCVEFHRTKRAVRTPSSEQVRQPIFTSARDQWKNYESYLKPIRQGLEGRSSTSS